jgi:hypothetical protein
MSQVEDIKRQLETAYAAIQELDDDLAAGRIGKADHEELKRKSERQAAALVARLRDAERAASREPSRVSSRPSFGTTLKSPLGLTIGGVALLAFGVVLGVLVARFTANDNAQAVVASGAGGGGVMSVPAGMPPGGMPPAGAMSGPGGQPVGPAGRPPGAGEVSPALDALRKDVEVENPPIKKLLAFANQALEEGHVPAAIWGYKRVMSREPKNVEAITQIGLILAQGNHMDQGLARIDEAISIDAKYPKAYWNKANILFHGKGDFTGAAASLETYLKLVPTGEHAEQARALLAQARTQAANGGKAKAATPATKPGAGPAR